MSQALENKDSPALKDRLQSIGFEQIQFEPKVNNRFIVQAEGFPSYVIRGIKFPVYSNGNWMGRLQFECYNPLEVHLEEIALHLVSKEEVKITMKVLGPTAMVDTTWEFTAVNGEVDFGGYHWSDEGKPNLITVSFDVKEASIN